MLYLVEGNHEWRAVDVSSGAIASLTKDLVGWPNDPVPSPDGRHVALSVMLVVSMSRRKMPLPLT